MDWIDILGYMAAGAIFTALWMKTAVAIRVAAVAAGAVGAGYGYLADVSALMMVHGWMLPVSAWRLYETIKLRDRLRALDASDFDAEAFLGFMTRLEQPKGTALFRRGDDASDIFYLLEGKVLVEELGADVGPGQLIGEMAMFTPDKKRTQSVRCVDNCTFMKINEDKALQLYADNPEFGLYLTKMMVARLLDNARQDPEPVVA